MCASLRVLHKTCGSVARCHRSALRPTARPCGTSLPEVNTCVQLCRLCGGGAAVIPSRAMSRRLPHYLKHERRRAGFTQADVAYLLGAQAVTKVSRYERGKYLPPLSTALAYEAMLGVPIADLFPSAFAAARRSLVHRVKRRMDILAILPENARTARRKRSLEQLLA